MTKRKLWRYHFFTPVRGEPFVDTSHGPPSPRISLPGGPEFLLANVPHRTPEPPVYIPWENISWVEEIEGDR